MTLQNDSPQLVLSLGLRQGNTFGHDLLQLQRPSLSGQNHLQATTFETGRAVTLVCSGLDGERRKLVLSDALRSGLLELAEEDTQQVVSFPTSTDPPGQVLVEPKPSPEHRQARVGLEIDSTAQIWKERLKPEKTYQLRFSADGGEAWCFYNDTAPDARRRMPVRRETDMVIFTVFDDPAPPKFSATFSVEPQTCHRSGDPPFRFVVEMSNKSEWPITVETSYTPFGGFPPFGYLNCVDQLIHCVDIETGKEVDWPSQFMCFDSDPMPSFPFDNKFVEVLPGEPWRFEHVLDEQSNSTLGGLEMLEAGKQYKIELSNMARRFGTWMYGRKEELLKGSMEEKRERWRSGPRGRGPIVVEQIHGPVVCGVVE